METATMPPYLTLSEASEFVYGDPEKQGYLFRFAGYGEFTLCWQLPHWISCYRINIEDGVLTKDAEEERVVGDLVSLSKTQVLHLINVEQVSANLEILLQDHSGEFSLFLPNTIRFSLEKGQNLCDLTYPAESGYIQMDIYPYLEAHAITLEGLYVRREDVIALKEGKSLSQVKESSEKTLGGKGRNAYLKTIQALSDALIGGLTGQPNTDANAVIAVLDRKDIKAVGERALADYLKAAKNIED